MTIYKRLDEIPLGADACFSHADSRELSMAIKKLKHGKDNGAYLGKVLGSCIAKESYFPMPMVQDKKGEWYQITEKEGKRFAVMYTADSEAAEGENIELTDIRYLIEFVFHDNSLDGIVINPRTTGLFLEKHAILKLVLHDSFPKQNNAGSPQRDWGKGIPSYTGNDIMTEGECLNFAMHTVLDFEQVLHTMTTVSACDHTEAMPNLILKDQNQFVFICVKGAIFGEESPHLSQKERNVLLRLGTLYNAKCFFAPVVFMSIDPMRFEAGLALKGDGFYANYRGLEEIK